MNPPIQNRPVNFSEVARLVARDKQRRAAARSTVHLQEPRMTPTTFAFTAAAAPTRSQERRLAHLNRDIAAGPTDSASIIARLAAVLGEKPGRKLTRAMLAKVQPAAEVPR